MSFVSEITWPETKRTKEKKEAIMLFVSREKNVTIKSTNKLSRKVKNTLQKKI
jgi:hypothetical protein